MSPKRVPSGDAFEDLCNDITAKVRLAKRRAEEAEALVQNLRVLYAAKKSKEEGAPTYVKPEDASTAVKTEDAPTDVATEDVPNEGPASIASASGSNTFAIASESVDVQR